MDTRLTTLEAAALAGVSPSTIRVWIKNGYLGDVYKQNVTRGATCGYKIEIAALNRYLFRRQFGYFKGVAYLDKIVTIQPGMNEATLRRSKDKLEKAIKKAQDELYKIETMLE